MIQKTTNLDNQNKREIESNEKNKTQIKLLKVENTNIKDNLEQHKEKATALKEKNKKLI